MTAARWAALCGVLALLACAHPVSPAAGADNDVGAACAAWRRLGCVEGEPTLGGETCETWATRALAVGASPHAICVVAATSCEAARACWGPR